MGLITKTEASLSSPYTVPAGSRVISYSFVGDTGGGTLTITNAGGEVSDAVTIDQGEEYGASYPTTGTIMLGAGAIFAWSGIAHLAIEELS